MDRPDSGRRHSLRARKPFLGGNPDDLAAISSHSLGPPQGCAADLFRHGADDAGRQPADAQAIHGGHVGGHRRQVARPDRRHGAARHDGAGLHGDAGRHHQQRPRRPACRQAAARWKRARRSASSGWKRPKARDRCMPGWADLLQKKLDVKPSRESNVINIGYSGADPAFVCRRGQCLCPGLHRYQYRVARRTGEAIRRLVRQPDQAAARKTGSGAESPVQLSAGNRDRRHRRAARLRNPEVQRTIRATDASGGAGCRRQQQAEIRLGRHPCRK